MSENINVLITGRYEARVRMDWQKIRLKQPDSVKHGSLAIRIRDLYAKPQV